MKSTYDAVKKAAGAHAVNKPKECSNANTTDYIPPAPPSPTFPEGTYRSQPHNREQLLAAGVDFGTATSNVGWDFAEVTFEAGTMTLRFHTPSGAMEAACGAPYTVDTKGYLTFAAECLGERATWSTTNEGISLEAFPSDSAQARFDNWDVSTLILTNLVSVS